MKQTGFALRRSKYTLKKGDLDKMIPVIVKLNVKEGKMDDAVRLIKELVAQVKNENGTLIYKFCIDRQNPNTFIVIEGYKDEASAHAHSSAPYSQSFIAGFSEIIDGEPDVTILKEIESI